MALAGKAAVKAAQGPALALKKRPARPTKNFP